MTKLGAISSTIYCREVRVPSLPDISPPPLMLPRIFHYRFIPLGLQDVSIFKRSPIIGRCNSSPRAYPELS